MAIATNIIHARWLITCEPNVAALEHHALVFQADKIIDILPSKAATDKYPQAKAERHDNHVLMPGFVNTHTHLAMNLFRGLADDLALMDWLNNHIWPAERAWVSPHFVKDASELAIAEMIRSGTTCFNDMYFFLQETAEATDRAGINGNIGITVIGFPTAWAKNSAEYIEKGLAFYHDYKNHPRIHTTLAPHAIYTVSDADLIVIRDVATQHQLKINMHIQETAIEVQQSIETAKHRPIKRLHDLGVLSKDVIAVHMTQVNSDDLAILTTTQPSIVHCPESNMKLASGICPVTTLQENGLNVALGTDGAASNNDLDMFGEMRTAALLGKLANQNPESLPALKILEMATLNGAKALGLDEQLGSLKIGKSADFIIVDLNQIETQPLYHVPSTLVYAAGREQVRDVWVAGKQLMKNRELLTLDEEALLANAKQWTQKIKLTPRE